MIYKKTIKHILAIILNVICGFYINAQELHFQSLTVNDGLSQNDVTCTMQDRFGFIWIGTYDGLNKFDGHKIKNYRHSIKNKSSLSGNRIKCLYEDTKKRIWIGTEGYGLNYFSQETEEFVRIKVPEKHKIVRCILETKRGDIILGTANGLLKIKQGNPFNVVELPFINTTIDHLTERNGIVYISSKEGVWKLSGTKTSQIEAFKNFRYRSLALDDNENLWTGRNNILYKITSNDKIEQYKLPKGIDILTICISKDNKIWIGTHENGLLCFDKNKQKVTHNITRNTLDTGHRLQDNYIINLFCDKSNTLWAGSRKGVCFANLSAKKFNTIPTYQILNNLNSYQVSTLFYEDNNLYVGFQSNGLYKLPINNNSPPEQILKSPITATKIIKIKDILYIATDNGLFTLQNNKLSKIHKDILRIFSICTDPFENIYIGTFDDLIIGNSKSGGYKKISAKLKILEGKNFFSLQYDQNLNCVWAGTMSDGLFKLNLGKDGIVISVEHYSNIYNNDYKIQNNSIWCIYLDKTGNIWTGTDAGLFFKHKNTKQFKQIESNAVIDKKILSIEMDNRGDFWLGSSKGLLYYSPKRNISRVYNYNDGLQSSSFTEASHISDKGILFFGGLNGADYFNPDEIKEEPFIPNIFFNRFMIHNQEVFPLKTIFNDIVLNKNINLTSHIKLNHKQNNFRLDFSSTTFTNANHITYRYIMKGYDKKPITVDGSQNFAAYNNLPEGTYTFSIEVANRDGVWNPNKREITFKIMPPIWLSIYAYIIYALVIFGGIFSFIYFIYHRQRLKYRLKINELQQRQDQEVNEMKLEFFTDIAHEFKTPLSLIIGPVNDLIKNNLTKEQKQFYYQVMARNTKRMSFLANQLLDFRKINAEINILKITKQDLSAFIKDIGIAFMWEAKSKEIKFNIITPEYLECYFDSDILEKSLYNLLSNAFKFTSKGGVVEIAVKKITHENKELATISIKDNGKGISDDDKLKIFDRFHHGKTRASSGIGLNLTQNLIKAHKGDILVKNSSFGGTEFILSIPINEGAYSKEEFFEEDENTTSEISYTEEIKINPPVKPKKEEKILIVEDDNELRAYLKNSLLPIYYVVEAENGIEGLKKAENELPDIIISDVMMPEMDGIEFCKVLKQNDKTNHIPVLMLTAKTDDAFKNQGLKAGAWDYITKPFNTDNLLQKIENIIKTRSSHKDYLLKQNLSVLLKDDYTPHDKHFIAVFTKMILKNMVIEQFTIDDYAKEIGLSRMQLHRKITRITNQSTTSLINTIKINYAAEMFDKGCDNVKEAMYATGFNNYVHFNNTFKKFKDVTPKQYLVNKNNK